MLSAGEVVFLLDVDNTLLDNDRFGADLGVRLQQVFASISVIDIGPFRMFNVCAGDDDLGMIMTRPFGFRLRVLAHELPDDFRETHLALDQRPRRRPRT